MTLKQKHQELGGIITASLSALLLSLLVLTSFAQKAKADESIHLSIGKAEVIQLNGEASEVLVSSPDIVDVSLPSSNRLYLMARGTGDANIFVFGENGEVMHRFELHVSIDEAVLQQTILDVLPDEEIEVRSVNRDLIVTGEYTSVSAAATARTIISRFVDSDANLIDLTTIRGQQQVMLRVRIVEVEKNILNELGLGGSLSDVVGNSTLSLASVATNGLTELPFMTGSLLYSSSSFGPVSLAVQALERDGMAHILAEPNLTALSGETASFLAGGEFPIPVAQDQSGAITIEFRKFGVSLAFTPTVMNDERIVLRLGTEVSSLSQEGQIELDNITIPALAVRRAETTIEMSSGGTLMIAGLLKSEASDSASGVPGAMDVPILGQLFRSDSFRANESELLIIVTALLVEPYGTPIAETATPPTETLPYNSVSDLGLEQSIEEGYGNNSIAETSLNGAGYIID